MRDNGVPVRGLEKHLRHERLLTVCIFESQDNVLYVFYGSAQFSPFLTLKSCVRYLYGTLFFLLSKGYSYLSASMGFNNEALYAG